MDPQEPIVQEPIIPTQVPDSNPQIQTKPNGIMILSMAVFVLLSLSAVAFLYYQNQQLKGMLANYQTPVASPTPTATTDPTANWKTYTDPSGYSFLYPNELEIEKLNDRVIVRIDPPRIETVVGICPRYVSFSNVDSKSVSKTTKDKYDCIYKSKIENQKILTESQYSIGSNDLNDQILSTFKFLEVPTASPTATTKPTSSPSGVINY